VSQPLRPLVAIGVGNVLLGDDAVGVRVIERLRAGAEHDPRSLPTDTRLIDGGTLGIDLLRIAREARGLVLVDAVRLGGPAGNVSTLHGDAIVAVGGSADGGASTAVGELLAVARLMNWLPEPVALVGIEVEDLELGLHLTAAVEAAIPAAMEAVRDELRRMDELPAARITGGGSTRRVAGATA
jgi:hydrogenase maturation protease